MVLTLDEQKEIIILKHDLNMIFEDSRHKNRMVELKEEAKNSFKNYLEQPKQ